MAPTRKPRKSRKSRAKKSQKIDKPDKDRAERFNIGAGDSKESHTCSASTQEREQYSQNEHSSDSKNKSETSPIGETEVMSDIDRLRLDSQCGRPQPSDSPRPEKKSFSNGSCRSERAIKTGLSDALTAAGSDGLAEPQRSAGGQPSQADFKLNPRVLDFVPLAERGRLSDHLIPETSSPLQEGRDYLVPPHRNNHWNTGQPLPPQDSAFTAQTSLQYADRRYDTDPFADAVFLGGRNMLLPTVMMAPSRDSYIQQPARGELSQLISKMAPPAPRQTDPARRLANGRERQQRKQSSSAIEMSDTKAIVRLPSKASPIRKRLTLRQAVSKEQKNLSALMDSGYTDSCLEDCQAVSNELWEISALLDEGDLDSSLRAWNKVLETRNKLYAIIRDVPELNGSNNDVDDTSVASGSSSRQRPSLKRGSRYSSQQSLKSIAQAVISERPGHSDASSPDSVIAQTRGLSDDLFMPETPGVPGIHIPAISPANPTGAFAPQHGRSRARSCEGSRHSSVNSFKSEDRTTRTGRSASQGSVPRYFSGTIARRDIPERGLSDLESSKGTSPPLEPPSSQEEQAGTLQPPEDKNECFACLQTLYRIGAKPDDYGTAQPFIDVRLNRGECRGLVSYTIQDSAIVRDVALLRCYHCLIVWHRCCIKETIDSAHEMGKEARCPHCNESWD